MPQVEPSDQYTRFAEDWRHYDTAIWAMPSIGMAVVGGAMTLAYRRDLAGAPRVLLLALGSLLLLSLAIALVKHRFFQEARSAFMNELEAQSRPPLIPFPVRTHETRRHLKTTKRRPPIGWAEDRTAFRWLLLVLACGGLVLAGLALTELVRTAP